ncbi:hypothetical protein RFI_23773, partial [Reticulomyxa filosa]
EVESEHGRFRMLLINNNSSDLTSHGDEAKQLSLGMLEELRRKITVIDQDYTTIAMGLTARDNKEYIGAPNYKALYAAHMSGVKDIGPLYFGRLLSLVDELVHLKKPLLIASTGVLNGLQTSLLMHGAARLCDAGTRLVFDHCQSGMIPCAGFFYRLLYMSNPLVGIWHALTGFPMNTYDAMEQGLVDWIIPPTPVLLFSHMGHDVDRLFRTVFQEQDRYRHRAMLKSVVELYDRGLEHYRGPCSEDVRFRELEDLFLSGTKRRGENREDVVGLDKFLLNLENGCKGALPCQKHFNDEQLKLSIHRLLQAKQAIDRASPLAIVFTYETFRHLMPLRKRTTDPTRADSHALDGVFQRLLEREYHLLCWLMHYGDLWEGIRARHVNPLSSSSVEPPKWAFSSCKEVLSQKGDDLLSDWNTNEADGTCIITKELPWHWCPKWEKTKRDKLNDVLFPVRSSLDGLWADSQSQHKSVLSWHAYEDERGSITGNEWSKKYTDKDFFLYDFTMLRGAVPPAVEESLAAVYGRHWRLSRIYQGRSSTASDSIKPWLKLNYSTLQSQ